MSKCVSCAVLNTREEHAKRSRALDTKDADGKVTRKGYHAYTGSLLRHLERRRANTSAKFQPHKFCSHHSPGVKDGDFPAGTGRRTNHSA